MVGVGRGAHAGVLIKNAEALERVEKIDTLVIDKTGTLTEGKPELVAVFALPGFDESQVLKLAASVERGSEHPLAAAIVAAAQERKLKLAPVRGFDAPAGKGVIGMVEQKRLALGTAAFLKELAIDTSALAAEAERLRADGATAVFLAINGQAAGVVAIAMRSRPARRTRESRSPPTPSASSCSPATTAPPRRLSPSAWHFRNRGGSAA
jgi:P-type E1-E2 ATPase